MQKWQPKAQIPLICLLCLVVHVVCSAQVVNVSVKSDAAEAVLSRAESEVSARVISNTGVPMPSDAPIAARFLSLHQAPRYPAGESPRVNRYATITYTKGISKQGAEGAFRQRKIMLQNKISSCSGIAPMRVGNSCSSRAGTSGSETEALPGTFPDSTRQKVGISPPFEGVTNLFPFDPALPSFATDFDTEHLHPTYKGKASGFVSMAGGQLNNSFSSSSLNNIQTSVPRNLPSTSVSDSIASALQAILHPNQQVPRE